MSGPARPGWGTAQQNERTSLVGSFGPGTVAEPQPRVYVWNTGQQRAGWGTVKVQGAPAGTPIQIRYAEKLGANGLVSITGFTPAGQIQTDYYIAKGTGTETFTPRFTYKGFQYVQISGVGGTALPAGVTAVLDSVQEVREPMPETGVFSSSSDLLNLIDRNMRASVAENYVAGVITDTPTYEKNGWTGDAQLSLPAASLQFDTERHMLKALQDMRDDQLATGEVPLLSPGSANYGYQAGPAFKPANGRATPIWDAWWFVGPWRGVLRALRQPRGPRAQLPGDEGLPNDRAGLRARHRPEQVGDSGAAGRCWRRTLRVCRSSAWRAARWCSGSARATTGSWSVRGCSRRPRCRARSAAPSATLSLTLGAAAQFGAFTPGWLARTKRAMTANVVSTAGDAALSVSDPGHLTNGSFRLQQPLQVEMTPASWAAPVSNAAVSIGFKQPIGANEPLRTGVYSRTLTFTLSTTNP